MAGKRCTECGAQLRLRSTLCPLCGADEEARTPEASDAKKPEQKVVPVEDYQADLRRLREELRALREAEAS